MYNKSFQSFTGPEYLKIDIANNFGLDKQSWQDRIDWFDQNEPHLHSLVNQAESPALFYAGILAWEDVLAGKPIGYMISLDATASGLQLLAVLTGDKSAASICNVENTGNREDAYTNIHKTMQQFAGPNTNVDRSQAKEAIYA